MLIELGANPLQTSFDGFTPFHELMFGSAASITLVDCLKLLIEAQRDVTEEDLHRFYKHYYGPPEAAEIMLAYDMDLNTIPSRQNASVTALHMALRNLLYNSEQWHGMIRRILRSKVDVHAQDQYGQSALDELLKHFGCPCNSHAAVTS